MIFDEKIGPGSFPPMVFLVFWDSIPKRCKGVHCVDLGESFPTSIYLQKSASIQPRTSPSKFGGKFNSLFTSLLRPNEGLRADFAAPDTEIEVVVRSGGLGGAESTALRQRSKGKHGAWAPRRGQQLRRLEVRAFPRRGSGGFTFGSSGAIYVFRVVRYIGDSECVLWSKNCL